MRARLGTIACILLAVGALSGATGFATCGSDARDDDESYENRDEATQDEMMDDAIRDSDR